MAEVDQAIPRAADASDSTEPTRGQLNDEKPSDRKFGQRQLSISLRGFARGALDVVLVAIVCVLGWLFWGAQHKIDTQAHQSEDSARAEKIALDYASNAAAMNFQQLDGWKASLVAGTTAELKNKLTQAAASMEQIIVPLQWNSTTSPLAAKVRTHTGTTYVVDAFVSVQTKTVQAPDPLMSTAAYTITVDSKDWQISDVGGVGAMAQGK